MPSVISFPFFGSDLRVPVGQKRPLSREIATGDVVDFVLCETASELYNSRAVLVFGLDTGQILVARAGLEMVVHSQIVATHCPFESDRTSFRNLIIVIRRRKHIAFEIETVIFALITLFFSFFDNETRDETVFRTVKFAAFTEFGCENGDRRIGLLEGERGQQHA
jgi:hypothetical protein